jgi:hypothetical protein
MAYSSIFKCFQPSQTSKKHSPLCPRPTFDPRTISRKRDLQTLLQDKTFQGVIEKIKLQTWMMRHGKYLGSIG